jgi:hypothetical protein
LTAAAALLALAAFSAAAPASAGVPGDNAVLLDPFDPVPQIGFHHDDCFDPCGYHRCEHYCGYRHRCEHDCYRRRGCDDDCYGRGHDEAYWAEIEAMRRYEHQSDMYEMLLSVYWDQLEHYDDRYGKPFDHRHYQDWQRDSDHGAWRDGDHRDGDHHDGDWHDGDHHDHDGDHHDGDHHDGDHHDGDGYGDGHHDGDHHDGDHHDGDGHDGDHHHDGEWQDGDGHWHDGPPPVDYAH